jgi:hypothetical protein
MPSAKNVIPEERKSVEFMSSPIPNKGRLRDPLHNQPLEARHSRFAAHLEKAGRALSLNPARPGKERDGFA